MKGKIIAVGDNVDTDVIAPTAYFHLSSIQALKEHCMEAIYPELYMKTSVGDVLVAGRNFGCGSSREQAAIVLKELGFGLVLARSFARIFFRNAVNVALPIGTTNASEKFHDGEAVEYSIKDGKLALANGEVIKFRSVEGPLKEILNAGGLVQFVRKQSTE